MTHEWMHEAACRDHDPELWTGDGTPGRGHAPVEALTICGGCPVRGRCLEMVMSMPAFGDFGVWGGTTPYGRRNVRRGVWSRDEAMRHGDKLAGSMPREGVA